MKNTNFIIAKTPNGVLVKRYYRYVMDGNGIKRREFYYSERMNLPEQLLYKFTNYYDRPISKQKKQNTMGQRTKFAIALALAGSMLIGGSLAAADIVRDNKNSQPADSNYIEKGEMESLNNQTLSQTNTNTQAPQTNNQSQQTTEIAPSKPTPVTYVENGITYMSLDSSLEVSRYNYYNLVQELKAYNASAPKGERYDFNPNIFDHAIFTGVQIRESSLILYDKNDTSYKGGFKIGSAALAEANEIAIKLTGKPVITNEEQLDDPVLSNKACMYIYIKNYQYLQNHINKNKLDVTVTPEMVIDTYLYGCGNIMKELSNGGYEQKIYSMDILSYADIVREYSNALFEEGLKDVEHSSERRNTFAKLYKVPEINKQILAERNAEKGE